jgi:hypothetical protein
MRGHIRIDQFFFFFAEFFFFAPGRLGETAFAGLISSAVGRLFAVISAT